LGERLERYRWLVVAVFAVPLLSGVAYLISDRLSDPDPLTIEPAAPADMRVYVTGAVRNPGVYPLQDGSRWIDALDAAGGAADDANLAGVNLARRAQDEDEIIVPYLAQGVVAGESRAPLVNINTASDADLASLPGIGEVRAERIIESRTNDGPFASPEDLLSRNLVPESVFADIAPLVTTN
jgi:competence protein ComEA